MTDSSEEPKLGKTIIEDFKQGGLRQGLVNDFNDLREFYLDDQVKEKYAHMGWFRWFFLTLRLLKILFLRLTPARRIFLIIGLALVILADPVRYNGENVSVSANTDILGSLIILFILMLELKDKLLAKNELAAGRAVQLALMPKISPEVPGWQFWLFTRPANDVGGDLVDFIELGKNKFGIALGDVTGKGLGAALFMAKIQAIVRALVHDYSSLAEFAAKLNHIFHRDSLQTSFASLIYLELAADSDLIRLLNAGHMPPIRIHQDQIEELPKGGPALGIIASSQYSEQTLTLNPNDILFLYSDGLTEACNPTGEFLGEKRLFDLLAQFRHLPASELGEKILASVDLFKGENRIQDDISIAVLKRLG